MLTLCGCLDLLERGTLNWNSGMVNSGMLEQWVEWLF